MRNRKSVIEKILKFIRKAGFPFPISDFAQKIER